MKSDTGIFKAKLSTGSLHVRYGSPTAQLQQYVYMYPEGPVKNHSAAAALWEVEDVLF